MRVVVVGPPEVRWRLRAELEGAGIEVAGEFASVSEARRAGVRADAIVHADGRARPADDEGGAADLVEPLTRREQEVLELLAEGLPNKSIAARLGISDQTVKFHVASIAGKLGASNRTDIVRRALRRGLVSL